MEIKINKNREISVLYSDEDKINDFDPKEYEYYIKINNKEILNLSKEELLREYPYFYVIPFERLKWI